MDKKNAGWRKSRRSAQEANCVEVHGTLTSVRDSKDPGSRLAVDVSSLVAAIRAGRVG